MFWFLTQQFLVILITAIAFGIFGWWLRPKFQKVGATRAEVDAERGKNQALEDRARKAEGEAKAASAELASLKSSSVSRAEFEAARKALADEQARGENVQVQLRKAREAQNAAEARNSDAGKASQAKVFALENELAGLREQAARDRQAAVDARAESDRHKANVPGKPAELAALEAELLLARRNFTASENTASEARRERDKSEADMLKLRDKIKVLEGELAVARGNAKPGAATPESDPASIRVALIAAEAKAADALRSVTIARDEAFALRTRVGLLEAELAEAASNVDAPATESDIEVVRNALHASQAEADEARKAANLSASQAVVLRTEISSLKLQLEKLRVAAEAAAASAPAGVPAAPSQPHPPTVAEAAMAVHASSPESGAPAQPSPAPEGEADLPPVA